MSALDDLIVWDESKAAGPARERVEDALRPEAVAAVLERANGSIRERAEARLVVRHYLRGPLDDRLRAERREAASPWNGRVDASLAAEDDPERRRTIADEFAARLRRLERLAEERDGARDEAARRAGVPDARALLARLRDPDAVLGADEVERGFVEPTDAAVEDAVRSWARREGLRDGIVVAADVPRMAWLAGFSSWLPEVAAGPVVRRIASDLRLAGAPPADGPRGAKGVVDALDALGRSLHATFLEEARGTHAPALADPAFGLAAGALFRGLVATRPGLRAAGLPEDDLLLEALRLERLIETRRAWGELREPFDRSGRHQMARRTGGRPFSPQEAEGADFDPGTGDAALTGRIFAALVEERLKTRFGHAWFARHDAGTYLRDLWAAEVEETPRRMAEALALGTMDSAPLIESCMPTKGRPS